MEEPFDENLVNANQAYQTAWIVYINGIECPAQSVSIAYGVWQIPECEITMIPDPALQRLGTEDRVSVQVFYCDYWLHPESPEFRLMFDGEIIAWSYVNVARNRAISFTAIDYMQIFTQVFFFFMSNVDDIAIGLSGAEIGVGINSVNTAGYGAIYPYSLFSEGLVSTGESTPLIKRPIDFVYNVVRGLTQHTAPNRSIPAANFFAPWTQRTKFHRRFIALPMLERSSTTEAGLFPILRAVQAEFAVSAVARLASSVGSSGSIWDMLQQILQTMMMEINMLPTAAAVSIDKYPTNGSAGLTITGPAGSVNSGTHPIVLTNYFVKPQFLFGIPPSCNVFYPSQIRHFAYEENYITQPTRMYFNEESWTSYLNVGATVTPGLRAIMRDALAVAHPEEVHLAARAAIDHPGENGKNILVYPEEFFKGPVVDRRPMPRWFTFLEQSAQGSGASPPTEGDNPPPSNNESEDSPVTDVAPGDSERNVYRLYAKYEFFKERYARRTGGLQLVFNPYPVPGFPCAVFDRRSTQVDVFGYVMSVRQNMHAEGWATQLSFSYGRTFREMFDLMHRQFTHENTTIGLQAAETVNAVISGNRTPLETRAERVGAVATAPPEPISEIRDVIQNFTRAEAFYRALFFRAASPDAERLDQDQLRAEADRRAQADAVVAAASGGDPRETDVDPREAEVIASQDGAQRIGVAVAEPSAPEAVSANERAGTAAVNRDLQGKRAAFFYNEIIEFADNQGLRTGLQLEGLDASARSRINNTLAEMRTGTASEEDLAFVRTSTGRSNLQQQVEGEDADPNVGTQLDAVEVAVRNTAIRSNITGDRTIVPRREALHLFESYPAAMHQAARPICTLDEYVRFLGDEGIREGVVQPETALAQGDSRTFPAKYYVRIRNYRPGPPPAIPSTQITNTTIVSNVDGIDQSDPAVAASSTAPATGTAGTATVQGLPDDFPQTRADWSAILLAYRANALSDLAPRT